MEYKLVIKDYNGLYTIYLTKLYKVLVGVIIGVIIVFNFYIYKKLNYQSTRHPLNRQKEVYNKFYQSIRNVKNQETIIAYF